MSHHHLPLNMKLYLRYYSVKLWVVDNHLLDHVGLPQVVIFVVHLVIFAGWVKGIIQRHFD